MVGHGILKNYPHKVWGSMKTSLLHFLLTEKFFCNDSCKRFNLPPITLISINSGAMLYLAALLICLPTLEYISVHICMLVRSAARLKPLTIIHSEVKPM